MFQAGAITGGLSVFLTTRYEEASIKYFQLCYFRDESAKTVPVNTDRLSSHRSEEAQHIVSLESLYKFRFLHNHPCALFFFFWRGFSLSSSKLMSYALPFFFPFLFLWCLVLSTTMIFTWFWGVQCLHFFHCGFVNVEGFWL